MSRIKIARQMISYLEERINCENVIKFADKNVKKKVISQEKQIQQLVVDNVPVAFEIINYNDNKNYIKKNNDQPNDNLWLQQLFDIFDFMTEANYTGFEIFPYLYGVLNCHENENSKLYVYYEMFQGNLIDLINNIEHPSEWYDIAFQVIMINYYIETVSGYVYGGGILQNHLYKKLDKPYYKEYDFNGTKISVNHKYLIVLWNIDYIARISNEKDNGIPCVTNNIAFLLKYLSDNKETIKILPSNRILKLLNDITNNPTETQNILLQYYGIPSVSSQTDKSNIPKIKDQNSE